jgi:hypothetical protein
MTGLRLPQPQTFDRLTERLATLKSSPYAASAESEIRNADLLISQGRLLATAGKLRQAGYNADTAERCIVLVSLQLKNAALKQSIKKASEENRNLHRKLSLLKARLADLSAASERVTPVEPSPPTDAPEQGEAP